MAMTLFELIAKLTLDTTDFDKKAAGANDTATGMAGNLEGVLARSVAVGNAMYNMSVSAFNGAINFGRDLVETAAEVQAENAQYAQVFQGVTEEADSMFAKIGELNNIHVGRLRTQGMGFFKQFASAGAETSEAMEKTESAMMLASDAAAFYDISLEDASYMLRSFLRGNVEAGESIGLFANDTLRTSYATELYGAKWAELNEIQRESVLLQIAQDTYKNANATGQASREAMAYANVLGNVKEQWRQIKAVLGAPILNALTPVLQEFEQFLKANPELVNDFAAAFGAIANALAEALKWLMQFIVDNSDKIEQFVSWVFGLLGIDGYLIKKVTPESEEAQTFAAQAKEWREDEFGNVFENYLRAALTESTEDDKVTSAEWTRMWQQDFISEEMFGLGGELFDTLAKYGIDIFGKGTSVEDLLDIILNEEDDKTSEEATDELLNTVIDSQGELITAIQGLPGMLAGLSIVMDGETVGHLVAPTVEADMARNARNNTNTSAAFG